MELIEIEHEVTMRIEVPDHAAMELELELGDRPGAKSSGTETVVLGR